MLERSMFKTERKTPEVSIAPLIDCVFLLVDFLHGHHHLHQGNRRHDSKTQASKTDVMLTQNLLWPSRQDRRRNSGARAAGWNRVTLESIIRAAGGVIRKTNVVIVADAESITQNVVTAMDIAKRAGAKKISMAEKTVIEIPSR
jgi:biopolymer transport protein ExbD